MKTTITYESVLADIKDINERNIKFNSLDDETKRKEIAWDALQLVLTKKAVASCGFYWDGNIHCIREKDPIEFQKSVLQIPHCEVCARGLVMLSTVRLGNEYNCLTPELSSGSSEIVKGFTLVELQEMEDAFEQNRYDQPYDMNTDEKLANICCNVLVNGYFNPKDKTDYLINE